MGEITSARRVERTRASSPATDCSVLSPEMLTRLRGDYVKNTRAPRAAKAS